MLTNKSIVFEKPWTIKFCVEELDESALPPGHALIKKLYSIISAGTELACLAGIEGWFPLPGTPGYSCVGEVIKTGENVTNVTPGDIIFCYGSHSLYEVRPVKGIFLRVPKEMDPKWIPFVRMASVAATATRISNIEWGDFVAVIGQGLVGNMALQLAKLQGARVIAIDVLENRLETAKQCGAELTVNSSRQDTAALIREFTNGRMVSALIEATGLPSMAVAASEWIAQNGELIFLGSPRGKYETDVTPFLNRIHLAPFNITVKGAHEWQYPENKIPFVKHSMERNSELIIDLFLRRQLILEPLLTEMAAPADCAAVYDNLRNRKDKYMGIMFDWTK